MDILEKQQVSVQRSLEHWYYRAKFALLADTLRRHRITTQNAKIVDVGCGLGIFLTLLEKELGVPADHLLGIDPACGEAASAIGGNARIQPAWPDGTNADLVLLMDVLEHTPDDHAVLQDATDRVNEGGAVFITVPAYMWLWSSHDEFLGHHRRYTAGSLRKLIQKVPTLRIANIHYYYASILPAAVPVRLAKRNQKHSASSDLTNLPPFLNSILRGIMAMERLIAPWNRLAGLTVTAVCKKVSAVS